MVSTTRAKVAAPNTNPSAKTVPIWGWIGLALAALTIATYIFADGRANCVANGFIALAVFTGNALYVVRKRFFLTKLGTLHGWMVGHIALGAVFFLAVYLHAGLTNIGTQGWILYGLTLAESLSGVWGLYELKATPRRFAALKQDFLFPSAIRRRISVLRMAIDKTVDRRPGEFKEWVESSFGAVLSQTNGGSSTVAPCEGFPAKYKRHANEVHEQVTEIVRLRGLLETVDRLSKRSRLWLWFHVPVSVALVSLISLHVIGWLYY